MGFLIPGSLVRVQPGACCFSRAQTVAVRIARLTPRKLSDGRGVCADLGRSVWHPGPQPIQSPLFSEAYLACNFKFTHASTILLASTPAEPYNETLLSSPPFFHRSYSTVRSPFRLFAKTLTYGMLHAVVAFSVVFAFTGSFAVALGVGLIEPIVQTTFYFFHELAWRENVAVA